MKQKPIVRRARDAECERLRKEARRRWDNAREMLLRG
jgi:hypothetical protein